MSKIINDGIQQGGILNAVPQAVRQSEMNKLTTFMTADDKASVLADYTLVDSNSTDYQSYLNQYPTLASEPVYVLNSISQAEIDKLNPILGKAFLTVSGIEQIMADPSKAASMMQGSPFDLSKLPPGTDVFSVLQKMPAAQLTMITSKINEKFGSLNASMVTQMAVSQVKAEYSALGMDTGKIQVNYVIHIGLLMLLVTLLSAVCTILVAFFPLVSPPVCHAICAVICSRRWKVSRRQSLINSRPLL
jgi:ATP-binding cassette subfamily B protein